MKMNRVNNKLCLDSNYFSLDFFTYSYIFASMSNNNNIKNQNKKNEKNDFFFNFFIFF